ncbi:MAG: hypothetical protein ACE5IJ_04260 [Thermoplasmata archaeon]
MAAGRGAALLLVGIFAITVAFYYRPLCFDIPEFSQTCIGSRTERSSGDGQLAPRSSNAAQGVGLSGQ